MKVLSQFIYKGRFLVAIAFAALLLLSAGCKKLAAAAGSRSALEALFEENILNRNFIVHLATDNGTDLTSQYTGYNFILTKTTSYYEGPMTGTKAGVTYTGTWSCNEDFSKLSISLTSPTTPLEFNFINRPWKFTKKAFPIMELAPWGTTEPKVLHMERL
ncbi:MAG: hypothetical protein H7Y86_01730 [Rhizobacter sp.]|nr:hypothetical protein [Ferruginibacter sp.]